MILHWLGILLLLFCLLQFTGFPFREQVVMLVFLGVNTNRLIELNARNIKIKADFLTGIRSSFNSITKITIKCYSVNYDLLNLN